MSKVRVGVCLILILLFISCNEEKEHLAPAVNDRDSVSVMTSFGVNTLISDSGIIKYRIVAETWDVNQVKQPTRWTFINGLFMEQFDDSLKIRAYIQADTAWYYDQIKLWELRGRVRLRNVSGLRFYSDELFWDGFKHELYSNKESVLITTERSLSGTYFRSDEQMNNYIVTNSKGNFVKSDIGNKDDDKSDTISNTMVDTLNNNNVTRKSIQPKSRKAIELQ